MTENPRTAGLGANRTDLEIQPLTLRIREACRLTGIGRSKLYLHIKEGHVEVVKVGSMSLIPMKSLEQFLGLD